MEQRFASDACGVCRLLFSNLLLVPVAALFWNSRLLVIDSKDTLEEVFRATS